MFSSNRTKLFYIFFVSTLVFSACRTSGGSAGNNSAATAAPLVESVGKTPFASAEPENYQAEIVSIADLNGEKITRETFVARSGANRLTKFGVNENVTTGRLETADGKTFLLDFTDKIYIEGAVPSAGGDTDFFASTARLNASANAANFEKLGTENNLTKYSARLSETDAGAGEILIFYDETKKIVTRQEFFTAEPRRLVFSTELKNFTQPAAGALFTVPADFKRVSAAEFDQIARQTKKRIDGKR